MMTALGTVCRWMCLAVIALVIVFGAALWAVTLPLYALNRWGLRLMLILSGD